MNLWESRASKALRLSLVLIAAAPGAAQGLTPPIEERQAQDPLTPSDAARYRKIFALQSEGQWTEADRMMEGLENRVLLGHVLAQRYLHPTAYRSDYAELHDWLEAYADHPQAARIRALALSRKPADAELPKRPVVAESRLKDEPPLDLVYLYESGKRLSRAERRKVRRLKRQIRHNLRRTYLTKTERLLKQKDTRRLFDTFELDEATAQVASGWLHYGKPAKALRLAGPVTERSGRQLPLSHWTAGLAAWRLGHITLAAGHFESLALSDNASPWNTAAGAYWAGRAHLRQGATADAYRWFTIAANQPPNFYSLLAQRRLNLQHDVNFAAPGPDRFWRQSLRSKPRGARALSLLRVGQRHAAEQELLSIGNWRDPETLRALLVLSKSEHLARLGLEMSNRLLRDPEAGWTADELGGLVYPVPPWHPKDGFVLDRALIFAFMRQESSFDARARSPYGARGLMQLMPRTAASLDGARNFRGRERNLLFDPSINITLGQRYLMTLLDSRHVKQDLLHLAVAYNAGLGNLRRWKRSMDYGNDPLLFIESFPALETRLFVERVMANFWIYRLRFGQGTPSLDALAADRWPAYESLDMPAVQSSALPRSEPH